MEVWTQESGFRCLELLLSLLLLLLQRNRSMRLYRGNTCVCPSSCQPTVYFQMSHKGLCGRRNKIKNTQQLTSFQVTGTRAQPAFVFLSLPLSRERTIFCLFVFCSSDPACPCAEVLLLPYCLIWKKKTKHKKRSSTVLAGQLGVLFASSLSQPTAKTIPN